MQVVRIDDRYSAQRNQPGRKTLAGKKLVLVGLSGNIQLARGEMQPGATDAHHIGPRRHRLAAVARGFLFRLKIGIDDADNGVFLPKKLGANVTGLENAVPHASLHSGPYHFEVTDRLRERAGEPQSAARAELKAMCAEMIAGTFPYMKT